MLSIIILLVLAFIVGMVMFQNSGYSQSAKRGKYLQRMADLFESTVEPLDEQQKSFNVRISYKDQEFVYEDIEEPGSSKQPFYKSFLKAKTPLDLSLSFTEKSRITIRDSISSWDDVANPWIKNVGKVKIPEELKEFELHTNNPNLADKLLAEEDVIKAFLRFKNIDARGHPIMSLEIIEGTLILRFHDQIDLKPNLFDLKNNVSSLEDYLKRLNIIAKSLNTFKEEQEEN